MSEFGSTGRRRPRLHVRSLQVQTFVHDIRRAARRVDSGPLPLPSTGANL
jgi:hypothetical protein